MALDDAPGEEILLPDQAATERLAHLLAAGARRGDVLALEGDLGAGKTTLARAFLQALGVDEEVPSPTFSLVQIYETGTATTGPLEVWHFDLYRLTSGDEVYELGFEQALDEGLCLIEWPERLGPLTPANRLHLHFSHAGAGRLVRLVRHGTWAGRNPGAC